MNKREWGCIDGAFLVPFQFTNKDKQKISTEVQKYILGAENLNSFMAEIESTIGLYIHLKDDSTNKDARKDTISKLKKTTTGLKKAIESLKLLDVYTQDVFAQYVYLTELEVSGLRNNSRFHKDPTVELNILYEATNSHLRMITSNRYTRSNTPRFLISEIVKKWRAYALNCKNFTNMSLVWRDYERRRRCPEVSLWLIVKMVLECGGTPLADPSNYIQEALENLTKQQTN